MTQPVPALLPNSGTLTRHRRPLRALTGIRFFAATYIVIFHTRVGTALAEGGHLFAGHFFLNGDLAVPLFFLLSGFILAYTYRQQIETTRDHVRFWEARFARIWPAYAFSLLCTTTVGTLPTAGLIAATLLMVQAWNPLHPEYAGVWNMVCWSLSVEAFFYLCFPTFQTWLERQSIRAHQVAAGLLLTGCVLANTAGMGMSKTYPGVFHWIPSPVIHLPEFLLGVSLGNLFLERGNETPSRHGLLTWLGLAVAGAVLCAPRGPWTSLVLLGFCLLIYGLASESTLVAKILSSRILVLGGAVSYSIYLLQTPVRIWVKLAFTAIHRSDGMAAMLLVPVVLILFSIPVFFWLEEPARKGLRALFAGISGKKAQI